MDTFKTESLPVYLSTVEAAQLLRLSPRTLEKHRVYGTGPSFRKIGGRVIYAAADLVAWAETGAKLRRPTLAMGQGQQEGSLRPSTEIMLQAGAAGVRLGWEMDVAKA